MAKSKNHTAHNQRKYYNVDIILHYIIIMYILNFIRS